MLLVSAVFVSLAGVTCTLFTPRFSTLNRPRTKSAKPLGRRRRSLSFLAIAAGLLTFFLPLVTTDPAVMGRSRWSAWNISWQIYGGNLPLKPENLLSSIPAMATAVYLLLVFAFIALCLFPSRDGLTKTAIVGLFTSWFWRGDRNSFEQLFYGEASYHNLSLVRVIVKIGQGFLCFQNFYRSKNWMPMTG